MKRGQKRHFLAHLGEFEHFCHPLLFLELLTLDIVLSLNLVVLLPQVLVVPDVGLELSPGCSGSFSDLLEVVIFVGTRYLLPHFCYA